MSYWQHSHPLKCPKGHEMGWLGSVYWMCSQHKPKTIFVQTNPPKPRLKLRTDGRIERIS